MPVKVCYVIETVHVELRFVGGTEKRNGCASRNDSSAQSVCGRFTFYFEKKWEKKR